MNINSFNRANQLLQKNLDRLYTLIMKAFEEPDNSLMDASRDVTEHFPWGASYLFNYLYVGYTFASQIWSVKELLPHGQIPNCINAVLAESV